MFRFIIKEKYMFLDLDKIEKSFPAAVDNTGKKITYGDLVNFCEEFYSAINRRTLILILSENSVGAVAGYVASLSTGIVPLLLSENTPADLLYRLMNIYQPEYLWLPDKLADRFSYKPLFGKFSWVLLKTGLKSNPMSDNLSLLLTTSGSTGSPKLVRHSYKNVESNARNIAAFFELTTFDRPVVSLPVNYTMGLSIVTSHLFAGSTLLLTKDGLTEKSFWSFLKEKNATSFTGVPYSFEVLYRLRFFRMDLPNLRLITQGGGKLREDLFREYAQYAALTGKRFIATYGQTEGTARMAYLPAEMALLKTGSIGKAIPGGELSLVDENGSVLTDNETTGEMVYRGPNVTLGYAEASDDLLRGDENKGILYTGDIARRDDEGYYYIMGRMNRFLKLFGLRISLDESENLIKKAFETDCLCTGNDEKMRIFITSGRLKENIHKYIIEKTGLFHKAVEIDIVDKINRNESGKAIYQTGII